MFGALARVSSRRVHLRRDGEGDVYKYEEGGSRAVRKVGHLHHGPIHDMCFTGKCLVSAGKDGKVKLWSVFMKPSFSSP